MTILQKEWEKAVNEKSKECLVRTHENIEVVEEEEAIEEENNETNYSN